MRIVPAPAIESGGSNQLAELMGTVHLLAAENAKLKAEAGKTQVRQVIVDRKIDNPALLETIEVQKKQIESLEKARLQASASVRTNVKIVEKETPVLRLVEKPVYLLPKWVVPALISASISMLMLGTLLGIYAGKS